MDDDQIIAALKRRDPEGARELLSKYGPRLLRSAFLLCDNETEAQDMVQETIVQTIRSINKFLGRSSLFTWIYGILLNTHRNRRRLSGKMPFTYRFPTKDITVQPDGAYLDMDRDASAVAQLIRQMSPSFREVIILRFYENMKIEEIARQTGLPLSTIKTRLRRGVQWLRRYLPKDETF